MVKKYLTPLIFTILFLILCLPLASPRAVSGYPIDEIDISTASQPLEINKDTQGWLWVSDNTAGTVWAFNPAAGTYQIYPVGGMPSDARRIGTELWWADSTTPSGGGSALFGKASTATGAYTIYKVPSPSMGLYSTTADASGNLWAADYGLSKIYKILSSTERICPLALPDTANIAYMTADGVNSVWLGDMDNSRLVRVNINTGALTWWALPQYAAPYSMALDADGHVWYSDNINNELVEFDPNAAVGIPNLRRYTVPNASPYMIAMDGSWVWYNGPVSNTIGILYPASAVYKEFTAIATDVAGPMPWDCQKLAVSSTGNLPWPLTEHEYIAVSVDYGLNTSYPGWKILEIPQSAGLWGVATREGLGWVVDYGRKKLLKIEPPLEMAALTACKLEDADGSLVTMGDQEPLAGWGMELFKDNVSQGQQVTGSDGCTSWSNLPVGSAYRVEEEQRSGWKNLTAVSCDKGMISNSGNYSCEFINAKTEYKVFLPLIKR